MFRSSRGLTRALNGIQARIRSASAVPVLDLEPAMPGLSAGELDRPLIESNGKFNNPWPWKETNFMDAFKFLRSSRGDSHIKLIGNHSPAAEDFKRAFPLHRPDVQAFRNPPADAIQATWIGHASMLIQMAGVTFLTDPVFSQRLSPLPNWIGPKRFVDPPFSVDDPDLPHIDFVLISHNHWDHLDYHTVKMLHKRFGRSLQWYMPLKLGEWFKGTGITPEQIHELDWWQEVQHLHSGVTVALTPAQHWSNRLIARRTTLWGGFVVKSSSLRFYFTGDTGYCPVFTQIGEQYGPFDLAVIPVGAYHPRDFFKDVHCDPKQAVQIHQDVKSRRSLGVHCCTFHLTFEPIDEPPKVLREEAEQAHLGKDEFTVMQHGCTLRTANGQDRNIVPTL